jgi:hypothetical protein
MFLSPTVRIAQSGLTLSRKAGVLEERLPWWGIFRTFALTECPRLRIPYSDSFSISPGNRMLMDPNCR